MPRSTPQQRAAFGKALSQVMERQKVSAVALADAVGVTDQSIRYYMKGRREPSMTMIRSIEKALGLGAGTLGRHFAMHTGRLPAALTGELEQLTPRQLKDIERRADDLLDGA